MKEDKIEFKLREEDEFIQLIQLLKATNIASTGGESQHMVTSGSVKLNGETELRKRAKIRRGDVVEVFGMMIVVSG